MPLIFRLAPMFRKIVAVVAVLSTFALGGCVGGWSAQYRLNELAEWVGTQPALDSLSVSRVKEMGPFGSTLSDTLQAQGALHVTSVVEFVTALDQLNAKFDELPFREHRFLKLDVKADIQGTEFTWEGFRWEPGWRERLIELLDLFAAPEVRTVNVRHNDEVLWVAAERDFQVSDDDARAYRDRLFHHLDDTKATETIDLFGFPLVHPSDPEGEPGSETASPSLRLSGFPQGYVATAAFAEKVDAAIPYAVRSVWSNEISYSWRFFTEDEYDEEVMKQLKELLSQPEAGSPIKVTITSSTRILGTVDTSPTPEKLPKHPGKWQEEMERVFFGF